MDVRPKENAAFLRGSKTCRDKYSAAVFLSLFPPLLGIDLETIVRETRSLTSKETSLRSAAGGY